MEQGQNRTPPFPFHLNACELYLTNVSMQLTFDYFRYYA